MNDSDPTVKKEKDWTWLLFILGLMLIILFFFLIIWKRRKKTKRGRRKTSAERKN
ncbi:Cell surface protein precursor [Lactococcus cremoris subsp. cremoris A76]|nr:Cell surface protein precursor [Lactococcus cremoris subsp. cremoris A76]